VRVELVDLLLVGLDACLWVEFVRHAPSFPLEGRVYLALLEASAFRPPGLYTVFRPTVMNPVWATIR
jgi:hypothetical protein